MAYTTLAKVKRYLKIPNGETSDDDLLQDFVTQSQSIIEGISERRFESISDSVRKFDAVGYKDYQDVTGMVYNSGNSIYNYDRRVLWFNNYDCCQITQVINGDNTVIANNQYVTLPINAIANGDPFFAIRLKMNSSIVWTWNDFPDAAISVTGRWAYSINPNADIVYATTVLAAHMYRKKDNSSDVDRSFVTETGLVTQVRLPQDVMTIVNQYRRLVI